MPATKQRLQASERIEKMRLMKVGMWPAAFLILGLHSVVLAHGGGLNADGCHNNRKTGDYHCHRGGGSNGSVPRFNESSKFQATPGTSSSRALPPGCFVGPRGGTYTITKSGRKNYGGC